MGLDLWFRQDVMRILAAAWETMQATAKGTRTGMAPTAEDPLAQAYERGFEDALRAVGVAFGLAASGRRAPQENEVPALRTSGEHSGCPLPRRLSELG
jgi:precorrin isomerase